MSRSRPSSKAVCAAFVALLLTWAAPLCAQANSPILTIDQDRLFSETQLGSETLADLERQAQALAAENAQIEKDLIAQELDLTEKRPNLPPDEFRVLANEFDQRVQSLRDAQDEKARQLNRLREEAQGLFLRDSADLISEIVRSRGAAIVLDRRNVFLSADSIDITDEVIARINARGAEE